MDQAPLAVKVLEPATKRAAHGQELHPRRAPATAEPSRSSLLPLRKGAAAAGRDRLADMVAASLRNGDGPADGEPDQSLLSSLAEELMSASVAFTTQCVPAALGCLLACEERGGWGQARFPACPTVLPNCAVV
jgi:hypothetical protein